jgi:hypothetical protein
MARLLAYRSVTPPEPVLSVGVAVLFPVKHSIDRAKRKPSLLRDLLFRQSRRWVGREQLCDSPAVFPFPPSHFLSRSLMKSISANFVFQCGNVIAKLSDFLVNGGTFRLEPLQKFFGVLNRCLKNSAGIHDPDSVLFNGSVYKPENAKNHTIFGNTIFRYFAFLGQCILKRRAS